MKDQKLLEVSVVCDDEIGCYEVGGLDYGIPYPDTRRWLEANPEHRRKLAAYLRNLAFQVEMAEGPFEPEVSP